MSLKIGFSRSRKSILAYSVLAISVIAALSSIGGVFAQTPQTSTSTTASPSSSQTGTGSQSSSSGSTVQCPNMGSHAGNGTTAAAATARYSA
ncbi:MAG TPA: hypothetical protein VGS04_00480 [Nitrososphaerales archaeon]|nr:hypothetical protein [Nitrososphaerales archaeon]